MLFMLLLFISFLVGIPVGIITSQFVRAKKDLPTILLFVPYLVLFFFSDNPTIDQIRNMLLALAIGILCTWSYFDTRIKKKKEEDQ